MVFGLYIVGFMQLHGQLAATLRVGRGESNHGWFNGVLMEFNEEK